MMQYLKLILLLSFFSFSHIIRAQNTDKPVDYSSFEIAKKYQKDKNYLFAYKHLLIFKFTNLERLSKSINRASLATIDKSIEEFEHLLEANVSWQESSRARGFTDKQMDSTFNSQKQKIILKEITIQ